MGIVWSKSIVMRAMKKQREAVAWFAGFSQTAGTLGRALYEPVRLVLLPRLIFQSARLEPKRSAV